jgi:hypothetical protein
MTLDPVLTDSQYAFLRRGACVSTRREYSQAQLESYRFRLTVIYSYGKRVTYYGQSVIALEDFASPFHMADASASTLIDTIVQD